MASYGRTGRGRTSNGPRRGRMRPGIQSRQTFKSARIEQAGDVTDDEDPTSNIPDDLIEAKDLSEGEQSQSEGEPSIQNAYANLLLSLNANNEDIEPARKRRKIKQQNGKIFGRSSAKLHSRKAKLDHKAVDEIGHAYDARELASASEGHEDEYEDAVEELNSEADEEETLMKDPFNQHFVDVSEQVLMNVNNEAVQGLSSWIDTVSGNIKRSRLMTDGKLFEPSSLEVVRKRYLKKRVSDAGQRLLPALTSHEKEIGSYLFGYHDVVIGTRTVESPGQLKDICCLHAVNHLFKTRDFVLKNNYRQSKQDLDDLDLRDQGFTRPKILIMVPTKQACVRFVDRIVRISQPEQQENKSRFLETYSRTDEDEWQHKPEDFRELFGGNHEEDFRVGLKFTRKTIKYFSGFYNSDIIIGSPLGLMRTITTGGGSIEKKKGPDSDFLSSIEMVIVDHANALQMQNWQHVDFVFSQLNLIPKQSHNTDFSRVRHWYLDGKSKFFRQTIILSDYLTPEINSLSSTHLHNIFGRVTYLPTYKGAMLDVPAALPITVQQTFSRFESPVITDDTDARFKHFTTTILPTILRDRNHQKGILVFVPSYLDFVRLRNHLSISNDATSLSFGTVSEYTEKRDVARARAHFASGRHSVLLYSERAHHYFRYKIKGVRKVVFYAVPENPIFWSEIISFIGLNAEEAMKSASKNSLAGQAKGAVRALFSVWDAMKLERIVGSERCGDLISDYAVDTFEFI